MSAETAKDIIIVDDEKSYLELMSQLLAENIANPVHAFTRPLSALQALPQLDPGLIVTDYYMPQINGLEFIVRARAIKPHVPFLIITGHGVHLSQEQYPDLPELKCVLHKPFAWHTLADEITKHWPDDTVPLVRRVLASKQA